MSKSERPERPSSASLLFNRTPPAPKEEAGPANDEEFKQPPPHNRSHSEPRRPSLLGAVIEAGTSKRIDGRFPEGLDAPTSSWRSFSKSRRWSLSGLGISNTDSGRGGSFGNVFGPLGGDTAELTACLRALDNKRRASFVHVPHTDVDDAVIPSRPQDVDTPTQTRTPSPAQPEPQGGEEKSEPVGDAAAGNLPAAAPKTSVEEEQGNSDSAPGVAAAGVQGTIPMDLAITDFPDLVDLGEGAMCKVQRSEAGGACFVPGSGDPVVLKMALDDPPETAENDLLVERNMLKQLSHPNILRLFGAGTLPGGSKNFIVLEFMSAGTIRDRLDNIPMGGGLGIRTAVNYGQQLASAMAYLNDQAVPGRVVMHRDLKPDNVGLTADGTIKLFDFGIAKMFKKDGSGDGSQTERYAMTGEVGSPRYMAPEVALQQPYNEKADVHSFAVLLWEMVINRTPFSNMSFEIFVTRVAQAGERPAIPPNWTPGMKTLLAEMWARDPDERPSFAKINETLISMKNQHKAKPARRGSLLDRFSSRRGSIMSSERRGSTVTPPTASSASAAAAGSAGGAHPPQQATPRSVRAASDVGAAGGGSPAGASPRPPVGVGGAAGPPGGEEGRRCGELGPQPSRRGSSIMGVFGKGKSFRRASS